MRREINQTRLPETHGYSADHVLHELLTTELLLNVWEPTKFDNGFDLLQTERRSIPSQPGFVIDTRGRETRLEPDAWFVYRQEEKGLMFCYCELDAGTLTKDQLKSKSWRYETWAASGRGREFLVDLYRRHGAENPRPVFRIIAVVCDRAQDNDQRRLEMLWDAVRSFPGTAKSLRAATANGLVQRIALHRMLDAQQFNIGLPNEKFG